MVGAVGTVGKVVKALLRTKLKWLQLIHDVVMVTDAMVAVTTKLVLAVTMVVGTGAGQVGTVMTGDG